MSRDGCISAGLSGCLLWLIILCFLITLFGCKTIEYVPKIEYQDVFYPQPCIIHINIPPEPIMEEYAPFSTSFTEDDTKRWVLEVERITMSNRAKRDAYIESLLFLVEEHNRLEPQCKQ